MTERPIEELIGWTPDEEAAAELSRLRQEVETLEDDLLRAVQVRGHALRIAAAELLPGPDGQDYIDREKLIATWVDDAHEARDMQAEECAKHTHRLIALLRCINGGPCPTCGGRWEPKGRGAPDECPADCVDGRAPGIVEQLEASVERLTIWSHLTDDDVQIVHDELAAVIATLREVVPGE